MRRAVVTGIGAVTPLGNSITKTWEAVKAARTGIGPITKFDTSGMKWQTAGELKGFNPEEYIPAKDINRLDLFVQYAAAAAKMAVEDAGLASVPEGTGIIVGSSRGGISTLEKGVTTRPSAFLMPGTTVSMASSYTATMLGARGHIFGISNACASGSNAIGEATSLIREARADVMLCGGAEAPICKLCVSGYGTAGTLSQKGMTRPFDRRRDGFVISEGATILVIEEHAHAISRGARIYAEVAGYGCTADAFHQTIPHEEGQTRAVRNALSRARINPSEVDLISAHATSTQVGDRVEAGTIAFAYGERNIPVVALKSMTGHLLGASGTLEAALLMHCIKESIIPPTPNSGEPEFSLSINHNEKKADIRVAVCHSFGFGGVNSVLVLKKI